MTELLAKWLNNDIELSKPIQNYEKDFANGFLIGELLHKFNQQQDFQKFSNKYGVDCNSFRENRDAKLKNFMLLEPTFRNLKIEFDSNLINGIINEKKDFASGLIYQLRTALDKVKAPIDFATLKTTGKIGDMAPAQKITPAKEIYDNHSNKFFGYRLQKMNKSQKQVDMENHLKKFEDERLRQIEIAKYEAQIEDEAQNKLMQEHRKALINKLKRGAGFLEEWDQKGIEDWGQNMKIKSDREQKLLEFELKQAEKIKNMAIKQLQEASNDVYEGIEAFEKNLRKTGIEPHLSPSKKIRQETERSPMHMNKTTGGRFQRATTDGKLAFSPDTAAGMTTMVKGTIKRKGGKIMSEFDKKERERRRRKMIVDQGRQQHEMENERRIKMISNKLKGQSKQEKQLVYEMWRTEQSKNIIIENRKLREARYINRKELDTSAAIVKEEELLRTMIEVSVREAEVEYNRHVELKKYNKLAKREDHSKICENILEAILDIANEAFIHEQKIDSTGLDDRNWNEWIKLFVDGKNTHAPDAINFLDEKELNDYLATKEQWNGNIHAAPARDIETNQALEDMPKEIVKNYYLGDAIETLLKLNYPQEPIIKKPLIPSYLPLKLCVTGRNFGGKSDQARLLSEKFNLRIFDMSQMIFDCIEILNSSENSGNPLRYIGEKINDAISEGNHIPDEIYIDLFIKNLNMVFPYNESEEEDLKIAELVENEGENLLNSYNVLGGQTGWILLDFPNTFKQAKLLEEALSGYVPEEEKELSEFEEKAKIARRLVEPTPKPQPPKTLIKSGIDCVIWIETNEKECIRRAVGRRADNENGLVYHVEDYPPPTTSSPLCERLCDIIEPTVTDKNIAFDNESKSLIKWLRRFGIEDMKFELVQMINGNSSRETIGNMIEYDIINQILDYKKSEALKKIEKMLGVKQVTSQLEVIQEENFEESDIKIEGSIEESKVEAVEKLEEDKKEVIVEKVNKRYNIDNDFKGVLLSLWENTEKTYVNQLKNIFEKIRIQRDGAVESLHDTQMYFISFLSRKDNKQEIMSKFVDEFNKFSDDFPDLREDEGTKEELQQRVETLMDDLLDIVEERKEQSFEERKKIMTSGKVEYEMEMLLVYLQQLMQVELDKYRGNVMFLQDYYNAIDNKLIPEPFPQFLIDIFAESEELPVVESEGQQYPRLDKMYEKAVKIVENPEEVVAITSTDAKGKKPAAAPAKVDPKKDPKKKDAVEEKKEEISEFQKELEESIKIEKSLIKYRLTLLKNWGVQQLNQTRNITKQVYDKLESWILVALKGETDTIMEMSMVIRDAIENQIKLKYELIISYMDFYIDKNHLNFEEEEQKLSPPREIPRENRFTISMLYPIMEDFIKNSSHGDFIENGALIDVLSKKAKISLLSSDYYGLPNFMKEMKTSYFSKIVKNIDRFNSGYINYKMFCTYLALLNSKLPKKEQLDKYEEEMLAVNGNLIDEASFLNIPAWFDASEENDDLPQSKKFHRAQQIKKFLFNLHKNNNGFIEVKKLIKTLGVYELLEDPVVRALKESYFNLIFS